MIYAELSGGLGNQMFIYAFARALCLQHSQPLTLIDRQDWKDGTAPEHTKYALDQLHIYPSTLVVADAELVKRRLPVANACKALAIKWEQRGGMMDKNWNSFERTVAPLFNLCHLHFATDGYVPCRRKLILNDFLAWGYFQSERYFAPYLDTIRAELQPKEAFDEASSALAAQIEASNCPVCVHVRRGDYQNAVNAALQVCGPAYYTRALVEVQERYPEAQLFVFSDDIAWARENLNTLGFPTVFAEGQRPAAQELALMRRCRHFVLSNSTFSWWAQELNGSPGKRVFAPDRWYTNGKETDLYGVGWSLIETK